VRTAVSDDDYEQWRRVRLAVHPGERAISVEDMRKLDSPARLLLLAESAGEIVGSGLADASSIDGYGSAVPRVVPTARGRGVGTTLLFVLATHLQRLNYETVISFVSDSPSLRFAQRKGFVETEREIEQRRSITADEPLPQVPATLRVTTLAHSPSLIRNTYDSVVTEAYADLAFKSNVSIPFEEWKVTGVGEAEATFLALHGDEVVGCAGLKTDVDNLQRAEHSLTAVRRDWRGRGVATLLKRMTLHWAANHGIAEVYTWTQNGNDDMRRLNEHLGYTYGAFSSWVRVSMPSLFAHLPTLS
jgi:GNAT superfamily N-acetyltransferase